MQLQSQKSERTQPTQDGAERKIPGDPRGDRRSGVVAWARIAAGAVMFGLNTLLHVLVLLMVALVKALIRTRTVRRVCDRVLVGIAESWIAVNTTMIRGMTRLRIVVESSATLSETGHYLVLANHQSWVDIPVLQAVFNRRIPLLRFFLKSQLIWVPLLGLAWWALDFPFMKRYSRKQLAKHPELAGRDTETTRRACEKFRGIPISVLNFVEGTRLTTLKHDRQQSPYRHLLRPKAGGVAFVLEAMGDALHSVLDVTIAYPHGRPTFVDLFADRIPEVRVHVRQREIPAELLRGDYQNDPAARVRAQAWINRLWVEKDSCLSKALTNPAARPQ
ncbi:MAG TPA: acyltransferase [Steroidobacteraceae bacterium]|nr:acyltransferase [Steroidobacteraceae bacterium]